jgi:hypothetical protein
VLVQFDKLTDELDHGFSVKVLERTNVDELDYGHMYIRAQTATHRQLDPIGTASHPSHVHIWPEEQGFRAGLAGSISLHSLEQTRQEDHLIRSSLSTMRFRTLPMTYAGA